MAFNVTRLDALDFEEVDSDADEFHLLPPEDIGSHIDSYLCHCVPALLKTCYGQDLYYHRAFKDRRH